MTDRGNRGKGSSSADDVWGWLAVVVIVGILVAAVGGGLFMGLILGAVIRFLVRFRPVARYVVAVVLALLGALVILAFGGFRPWWGDLVNHIEDFGGRAVQWRAWPEAFRAYDWLRWLFLPMPATLPLGAAVPLLWPVRWSPERAVKQREEVAVKSERRDSRRAARRVQAARLVAPARSAGIRWGAYGGGSRLWGNRSLDVVMPVNWLTYHTLVVGATGSGKTETVKRLAVEASGQGYQVVYIDGKGDRDLLGWFVSRFSGCDVMSQLGDGRLYDGFQGDSAAVFNRLMALLFPPSDRLGDGEYYRTAGADLLDLVLKAENKPPRSWADLQDRLDPGALKMAYRGDRYAAARLDRLDKKAVDGLFSRVSVLAGRLSPFVDGGGWVLRGQPAYFLVSPMAYGEDARSLVRFLAEDVCHYLTSRRPSDNPLLIVFDEFSAVPAGRLVTFMQQARGMGGGLVLTCQSPEGLGDLLAEIVTNAGTTCIHRLPDPEIMCRLAGTKKTSQLTYQVSLDGVAGGTTGLGSLREVDEFQVKPDSVRRLPAGSCYLVVAGQAARVQVARV